MTHQEPQPATAAIPLPRDRSCPYAPPDAYASLREQRPISRLSLADGTEGWLLTRYDDVRMLLSDPRFSARDRTAVAAARATPSELIAQRSQGPSLLSMDPPEHSRLRRPLTRQFSARRMHQLRPRVREIVLDHLAAMAAAGPPVDLVPAFALPIPSLVICELLGVPAADRGEFETWSRTMMSVHAPAEELVRSSAELAEYLRWLIRCKQKEPADDLLSALANPDGTASELIEGELVSLGIVLLVAGHETTANMIALGTFTLLQHPHWWDALVRAAAGTPPDAESDLTEPAVEELLRYLSIVHFGLDRRATVDVEIHGQLIRAGEVVLGAVNSANHDPERFTDPDRLALDEPRPSHVAFGYGGHQCVGQQLARVELRIVFTELPRRFPGLRLAVPPEKVPMRHDMIVYGVDELPVTWDGG